MKEIALKKWWTHRRGASKWRTRAGGSPANASIAVSFNATALAQVTTDGTGAYAGSFVVPQSAPEGVQFLTALHASGAFAASAIEVPEPSASLGAGIAFAAIAVLGATRPPVRAHRRSRCAAS